MGLTPIFCQKMTFLGNLRVIFSPGFPFRRQITFSRVIFSPLQGWTPFPKYCTSPCLLYLNNGSITLLDKLYKSSKSKPSGCKQE